MKQGLYECREAELGSRRCSSRPLVDVLLLGVSLCLLLGLGLLLKGDLRSSPWADTTDPDPDQDPVTESAPTTTEVPGPDGQDGADSGPRRRLLALGVSLLLVSLAVCLYVMCRLGLCCGRERGQHRLRTGLTSVNSRLHLIADLPPSYDAVVFSGDVRPPPYCAVLVLDDKPQPRGQGRPQEAG